MSKETPATLLDVANRAGVSRTTASDALRGFGRVSPATRAQVLQAARELDYVTNNAARALRSATTKTIGLHLPDSMTRTDYYMSVVFGVLEQAAEDGYDVTLMTSKHKSGQARIPHVDGVILGDPLVSDPIARQLMRLPIPRVTMERLVDDDAVTAVLWSDHEKWIEKLLTHMLEQGASAIGLLASSEVTDWGGRVQYAYREWSERNGLSAMISELPFGSTPQQYADATVEMLNAHPAMNGLLCGPDGSAAAVVRVLRERGIRVGDDFLVAACVDNSAMLMCDPPITAIDLSPREAGSACVRLLLEVIRGHATPDATRTFPITAHFRGSTAGNTALLHSE
ncbi:LacI family DNA-binding transcriptional regulator [Rhodococcus qingshengii]|uniref:LacI family DNA-binding transcriptional regulator n=1 Tax=Rhodococcus qingshengii TaxID=334542 RepID=UPI0036DF4E4E